MLNIQELKGNAPVTTEQYKKIDAEIKIAARRVNIARKLVDVTPIAGLGVQTASYDTLTEMSDAILTWAFQHGGEDIVNLTRSNVNIPIFEKKFRISRRDLASSQRSGTPLNLVNARSATYKVGYLENETVLDGYKSDGTNYDINGLYQGAGNSEATSLDWGTAANIVTSINNTIALLIADNIYPPYDLTLNQAQWSQAGVLISNSAKSYREWIKEQIGGNIYVTPYQAAGTGMMTAKPGMKHFELYRAQDITLETWLDPDTRDMMGRVFECVIPLIYDSNAISKMTTI